jgi:hypothetical protein
LEERISGDLRKIAAVERAEQSSAKIALVAATHLNRLVGDLGFHLVPPASARPEITTETGSRPAFATRPIAFSASEIADEPKPFGITYVTDWFHGFYRVAEENAMTTSGVRIDLVQNNRLKAILDGLESRLAA